MISYKLSENVNGAFENVTKEKNDFIFNYPCSSLFSCTSYEVTFERGKYFIQLWGGEGGGVNLDCNRNSGGKGAYVSGYLTLKKLTKLYLFLGAKGYYYPQTTYASVFNGGGFGNNAGGGAGGTDLRINLSSLVSRIMVAGAGGGSDCNGDGGAGGALNGLDPSSGIAKGGTQTSGGYGSQYGTFGKGGSISSGDPGAGGGGGYYGGGISSENNSPGAGGSSYVSGFPSCKSVKEDGSVLDSNIHYSLMRFSSPKMLDGKQTFSSPYGSLETGHNGNGAAKVTVISPFTCKVPVKNNLHQIIFAFIMIK